MSKEALGKGDPDKGTRVMTRRRGSGHRQCILNKRINHGQITTHPRRWLGLIARLTFIFDFNHRSGLEKVDQPPAACFVWSLGYPKNVNSEA